MMKKTKLDRDDEMFATIDGRNVAESVNYSRNNYCPGVRAMSTSNDYSGQAYKNYKTELFRNLK